MAFHLGVYHFKAKQVAFRNDYCLSCAAPRRAIGVRTFDVVNVMFVPLIPLGHRVRWKCAKCRQDPHQPSLKGKAVRLVAAFIACVTAVAVWILTYDPARRPSPALWAFQLGVTAAGLASVWMIFRMRPPAALRDRLREVRATDDTVCPLDATPLVFSAKIHCPRCGLERNEKPDPASL